MKIVRVLASAVFLFSGAEAFAEWNCDSPYTPAMSCTENSCLQLYCNNTFTSGGEALFISATGTGKTGLWAQANTSAGNASGVFGFSEGGNGVEGHTAYSGASGVYGATDATSFAGYGVAGRSGNGSTAGNGTAILGDNICNSTSCGFAGFFTGRVYVAGTLHKAGGGFQIDHPAAPSEKTLSHSFVESPDMKNIYDGVAVIGLDGKAVVVLPTYFEQLNRDFRYQLTPIGAAASLYVAAEVANNRFTIAGGTEGQRVSWQITGIRKDAWAQKYRIAVEENKQAADVGTYLNPECFNQPESKRSIDRNRPLSTPMRSR